jgi:hypothetical protein
VPWLVVVLIVFIELIFFNIIDLGVELNKWSYFVRVLLIIAFKFKHNILEIKGRILLIVKIPSSLLDLIIQLTIKHMRR